MLHASCQQTSSGDAPNIVSGTAVSTAGRVEWQVVSHEIGHNFGAIVRLSISFVPQRFPDICFTARRESSVSKSKKLTDGGMI